MKQAEGLRLTPFTLSILLHGGLVAFLVFGPSVDQRTAARPIYEQEIKPHQDHLVWYNLSNRLPEVKPAADPRDTELPRARHQFTQPIVAGRKDVPRPAQLIRMPAPEISLPKPLPLPNVLAGAAMPPPPVREFKPPPDAVTPRAAAMPEAPRVDARPAVGELAMNLPNPKLPALPFTPPPVRPATPAPVLPAAPALEMPVPEKTELPRIPRGFVLPPSRVPAAQDAPALPAAPALAMPVPEKTELPRIPRGFVLPPSRVPAAQDAPALPAAPALAMPVPEKTELPRIPRGFVLPPTRVPVAQDASALPAAPALAMPVPEKTELPRIPRGFVAPPARVRSAQNASADLATDAPSPSVVGPGQADLAIAGLNPVDTTAIPPLPGSHAAGFSAGPRPRPNGAEAGANEALLVVPGLMAQEGARDARATLVASLAPSTSPRNLMEAVTRGRQAPESTAVLETHAVRVNNAPDPRLEGRRVYTVAIQMPNVTSFSGSWLVWFAERHPESGLPLDMSSPVPIHKVDPKYVQAAAEERIEGTVRLFGVIRASGQVDSVELLHHLDGRLDQTAAEALKKWVFEPARRDGTAVDVDAVFEIPFHLAPKLAR